MMAATSKWLPEALPLKRTLLCLYINRILDFSSIKFVTLWMKAFVLTDDVHIWLYACFVRETHAQGAENVERHAFKCRGMLLRTMVDHL